VPAASAPDPSGSESASAVNRPGLRAAVVLLAAGEGRRVGADTNKVLLPLAGLPVFAWSLRAVAAIEYVDQLVVVVRPADHDHVTATITATITEHFTEQLGGQLVERQLHVVDGGSTRHGSEWNALQAIAADIDAGRTDVVAIHDAARPLADPDLFHEVIATANEHGGALPVRERRHLITAAPGVRRAERMVGVQTPQAFRARPLLDAYRKADRDGFVGTDTASCVEEYTDLAIHCVPSPATNLKITFPEDVTLAERLLHKEI
jgi:2-C-methyl-D-erythritol 4-phosphate cytidylyltransferase